jgi:glucose-6-phosphate isomerase
LWRADPSVWSVDPVVQQTIANRLGWMRAPALMTASLDRLRSFAEGVVRDGFTHVVLLGMGGSSLAPDVLRAVVGTEPGWLHLHVLDSTDPAAVRAISTPIARTLFVLASKSGTTIEPNVLAAHFRGVIEDSGATNWSRQFVAITDEGTALAVRARDEQFRETFVNPSDIGGRYSALSFFGLVPAALMGQDVGAMVGWATAMLAAAEPGAGDVLANPAVGLGLLIGAAARAGRDKLTLLAAPDLEPFGVWVEQLVAESTGKHGVGVVPIISEPPTATAVYGGDRLFVHLRGPHDSAAPTRGTGHLEAPSATIDLLEPSALGAEFVRWEIATAVAGALLGVNPFDEPNVQQAKDATRALLGRYQSEGRLPVPPADGTDDQGVALTLTTAARNRLGHVEPDALLTIVTPGDYVAVLAYLGPDAALADALQTFRIALRDRTRAATTLGTGPRYLHSTGQLHKGGPNSGVFVLVTADPAPDLDIPGERFSFGTLELAQGVGDFTALEGAGRRALHVHLPRPDERVLSSVLGRLLARIPRS